MEIQLTWPELLTGAMTGVMRQMESLKSKRADAHGYEGRGWELHVEGACGELAAARALGRFWSPSVCTFKAADIGQVIQVRTRLEHHYDLLVRQGDADDQPFVLVTGTAPSYVVRGWIMGRDAKQPEWQREHGGRPTAFFVPQSELRDLESAIAGLPERARTVLVLHDVEGYRHSDIAEITGMAVGSSKAQLHRARKLIRSKLGEKGS